MARSNMKQGITLLIMLLILLGLTFVWAGIYLTVVK